MSFYSINLFISIWTHGYFIVALSSSAIIVVQFIAQIVSDLAIKSSSKWVPMSFWNASIIFWALFFCFDTSRCYRVISYIPCPSPGINPFSKESWFLLLENIFKNQDLGQPGWLSGLAPPSAQGMTLETQDRVPRQAFCMEPASPSACVSAPLSLSLSVSHE